METAGDRAEVAALELNVYFIAADPDETADSVETRYVDLVEAVRAATTLPLALQIGAFFSSVGHMAHRLVAAGEKVGVVSNHPAIERIPQHLSDARLRPCRAAHRADTGGVQLSCDHCLRFAVRVVLEHAAHLPLETDALRGGSRTRCHRSYPIP